MNQGARPHRANAYNEILVYFQTVMFFFCQLKTKKLQLHKILFIFTVSWQILKL